MNSITISRTNKTIEITKKFDKLASKFGSDEYNALQEARRDYPTYKVVVASPKSGTKKNSYKGLTFEYMEKYIKSHDDEEKTIMSEYLDLRGESDEAKENLAESVSYLEIREWFLDKFPAIKKFHNDRKELLKAS